MELLNNILPYYVAFIMTVGVYFLMDIAFALDYIHDVLVKISVALKGSPKKDGKNKSKRPV